MNEEQGTVESKDDFKGEQGTYSRWKEELDLADAVEKDWRKDVEIALATYRSDAKVAGEDGEKTNRAFNLLWANVETKRPALYNSTPRPDIRRRHRDKDRVGRAISELMERSVSYVIDCEDMDSINKAAVMDMLLPGRAITRVKYIPTMVEKEPEEGAEESEQEVVDQQIRFDQIQYNDFKRGPGKSWDEVRWVSFDHRMNKDEVTERWGEEIANSVKFNLSEDSKKPDDDESDSTIFKRALIHEIWDKDERQVIWIADGRKEGPLGIDEDPLDLKGFFDIPKPLYAIESSTSLVPITEYSQYIYLATDLEDITRRIRRIISACRVRGIYDSTIAEMGKLFDGDDNEFIPAEDLSRLIETGGLDKAIWTLPLQQIAEVLTILKQQRRDLVQEIYELTGISDIQRGSSNPHETKGAQEIKATFGGQRLKRQQTEVQRYLRDIIRLVVEIIADKFSRQTLTAITGLNFPTNAEKQQAKEVLMQAQQMQQQAQQMAQMTGQKPPPIDPQMMKKAQETLQRVSWEDIESVLKSDMTRDYRIDVETDSTIQDELKQDQQARTELLTSMGQWLQTAPQAVQQGIIDYEGSKEIMLSVARSAKMGRSVEDAIENMKPPQKGPSPEQQKAQLEQQQAQMDMKMEQQKMQMEMQAEQARMKMEQQQMQLQFQLDQANAQMEMQKKQADMAIEREKLQNERIKIEFEREKLKNQNAYDEANHKRQMEVLRFDKKSGKLSREAA